MDARHFISRVLSHEIGLLAQGIVTRQQFDYLVEALERQSFVEEHKEFFPAIRELASKVDPNKRSTTVFPE